jgi:hypothetical protein
MFVAKVTGSVVATQKVDSMVGHKLLVSRIASIPKIAASWYRPAAHSWQSMRWEPAKATTS